MENVIEDWLSELCKSENVEKGAFIQGESKGNIDKSPIGTLFGMTDLVYYFAEESSGGDIVFKKIDDEDENMEDVEVRISLWIKQ